MNKDSFMDGNFPAAMPHGVLQEVYPDVFFVTGTATMRPCFRFSRNMTIVRQNNELTLINTVRLNAAGLASLEELGQVKHVVKIGAFHGRDDPFYADRYRATFWALPGQDHSLGLTPDVAMTEETRLPVEGASLFLYKTPSRPEGLIHLRRGGGILIACDSLQNWTHTREGFNLFSKIMMRFMGFIKPANVGPGWIKLTRPKAEDFVRVKTLQFRHLLSGHGEPLKETAYEDFSATFKRLYGI